MGDVVHEYVRLMKISAGLNRQLVFDAWDAVSGVAEYTVGKYPERRSAVLFDEFICGQEPYFPKAGGTGEEDKRISQGRRTFRPG